MTKPVQRALRWGVIAFIIGVGAPLGACALAWPSHREVEPAPDGLGAETVSIASESGATLRAWFARGAPGGGAVLLLHGAHEDRSSMMARASFLKSLGFSVLAPDFQAHGESRGPHITFGVRESQDAAAAFAYLGQRVPGERIGVIGVSMGGAAALLGGGPLDADAFVLESVYPTILDATRGRLGVWFGPLGEVGRALAPTVIAFVGTRTGVADTSLRPIDRIDEIDAPLLMVTGTRDRYTPLAEAESLYAHAPDPKAFWAIDGAKHEDLHEYAQEEYERRVGSFLAQHLRQGSR